MEVFYVLKYLARISIMDSGSTDNIHLTTAEHNCPLGLQLSVLQRTARRVSFPSPETPRARVWPSLGPYLRHLFRARLPSH